MSKLVLSNNSLLRQNFHHSSFQPTTISTNSVQRGSTQPAFSIVPTIPGRADMPKGSKHSIDDASQLVLHKKKHSKGIIVDKCDGLQKRNTPTATAETTGLPVSNHGIDISKATSNLMSSTTTCPPSGNVGTIHNQTNMGSFEGSQQGVYQTLDPLAAVTLHASRQHLNSAFGSPYYGTYLHPHPPIFPQAMNQHRLYSPWSIPGVPHLPHTNGSLHAQNNLSAPHNEIQQQKNCQIIKSEPSSIKTVIPDAQVTAIASSTLSPPIAEGRTEATARREAQSSTELASSLKRAKVEQDGIGGSEAEDTSIIQRLCSRDKQEIIAMASATATLNASSYANNVCQKLFAEMSSRTGLNSDARDHRAVLGMSGEVIRLNIGGTIFATTQATLSRVPGSYLAMISSPGAMVAKDRDGNLFIDRNPKWFEIILDALREPNYICGLPINDPLFQRELEFYGLLRVFLPNIARAPLPTDVLTWHQQLSLDDGSTNASKNLLTLDKSSALEAIESGEQALLTTPNASPTVETQEISTISVMKHEGSKALRHGADIQQLDRLVVVGGFNESSPYKYLRSVETYNAELDCWEPMSDMFWDRSHSGVVTHGQDLFVLGGRNERPDGVVGNFNAASRHWQEAVDMILPVPVFAAGFAVHRGSLLLIGGCYETSIRGKADRVSNRVFEFPLSPARGFASNLKAQWKQAKANLRTARGRHQCVVLRGKVYAIGGVDAYGQVLSSVERYHPGQETWEEAPPLPQPRRDFGCVVADGCVYVVGGADIKAGERAGLNCLSTIFCFDPSNGKWETMPPMQHPRQGLTCALLGGKIYAIGGSQTDDFHTGPTDRLRVVERFDVNTQTWENVASLQSSRAYPGSGVVHATW